MRVRRATEADLESVVGLENLVFTTDRISRRSFRRFLATPPTVFLTAEEDGAFAGYALVLFRPNSAVARLYSIAVQPEFARRGIGRALIAAAERAARRQSREVMRLEVQTANGTAIARYRKSGYRELGRRPAYYLDGTDAFRFEKRLR
jgi:ribosomal-protein-alanine acetyltransferase